MTRGRGCRVLLVGMMGSGKSTIGRLLSDATGWPYADNDELVLRTHGATPRRLLAERGEVAMRRAESEALAEGLRMAPPVIVGVAAGAILDEAARRALRDRGLVVWLQAGAERLAERAAGADHRPWLDADPRAWMAETLAEREPLYASVADHGLDTDAASPEETAGDLLRWLRWQEACAPMIRTGEPS